MALEGTSWSELTQLVTDHGFSDKNRDVLPAIMNSDGVPDHVWSDHGTARPCLDDIFGVLLVLKINLLRQMLIHKRTLF